MNNNQDYGMAGALQQTVAMAVCAMRVSLRRPIVIIVPVASLLLMPVLTMLTAFELGDAHRMARDAVLAVFMAAGMLLAFTIAAAAAYARAAPGALALIFCKPVSRAAFLLGRHAGMAALMAWFALVFCAGALLVERMSRAPAGIDWRVAALFCAALSGALIYAAIANYRGRVSFAACAARTLLPALFLAAGLAAFLHPAGGWCRFGQFMDWELLPVCALLTLALQAMTALASLLTAWCRLPAAICWYFAVLTAGALADYLVARAPAGICGAMPLRLLPAWQDFWMIDALSGGGVIGWNYVAAAAVYAALLTMALLTATLASSLAMD